MNTKACNGPSAPTLQPKTASFSSPPSKKKFSYHLKDKKQPAKEEKPQQHPSPMSLMSELHLAPAAALESSSQITIAPSISSLFQEIVQEIHILMDKGDRETTIYFNESSSAFSGLEISIKEFSSAPKIFNIELVGSPETVELLNLHLSELTALFHSTPMTFSVHRIETKLTDKSKGVLQRKEEAKNKQIVEKVSRDTHK